VRKPKTAFFGFREQKVQPGLFALLKESIAPEKGARRDDKQLQSSIREESENDTFRIPWSEKSHQDFLRPYQ
jgi:hypothetical protein